MGGSLSTHREARPELARVDLSNVPGAADSHPSSIPQVGERMTPRSLATVLLKCMGLFLVVDALQGFRALVEFLGDPGTTSGGLEPRTVFLWQAVHALLLLAIGIALLVNTSLVLRLFFRDLGDTARPPEIPGTQLAYYSMALSLLGAWVLSSAIPWLLSRAVVVLAYPVLSGSTGLGEWTAKAWIPTLYEVISTAFGLALFFSSRRIATRWFARQSIQVVESRGESQPG